MTLAQLFGSTKATAEEHKMKVSFFNAANMGSNACELNFTIDPAPLTPSITGTATKTYDGTADVAAGQLSVTLTGVVDGDTVTAAVTSYAYDNANAGENKTITASGITLTGADAGNYTLSSTTATTTGTITKSQPAIVFASGYNPSKDYDGQAIPDPTADNLTITGADFSDVTFAWSATPKDAGTYTLTAKIAETNNTEAAQTDALTVTISPKAVTPTVTITPGSYEYTGSAIRPSGSAVKVMDGNTVIPDSEYTLSYGENTQAGNGSVTVTDKENGNYTIAQTTETFTITKANQATLTITGAPSSVTYGDTFQLGVSGGSGSGALSWAASGATVDNAGNVTITRAGTVIITAAKDGDSNYSGIEARIMLNVSKKALTVSGVDAQDRAYDGTNKVAITAVTLSGIVPGDEGKVEVGLNGIQGTLSGVNAGKYTSVILPQLTLTGEGSGNYTLLQPETAVPASVKITPLDAVITIGTDTYHKTFGDAAFTLDVTDNNTEADVRYEVTEGADVVSVENGTATIRNAGTAAITVSLPATANYNAAVNKTITVTVDKKNGYTVAALNRNYFYQDGGTDSIDIGLLLPKDCGNVTYGEPAVSGNVAYSADPAVSGGKLSYTLDSGNINDEGTITVTVTTRNFEDITVTVNVKLTDQIPVSLKTGTEVTLKNNVLTYGEPLSDLVFNGAEFVTADGKTVAGTLAWKEAATTPNAGTVSAVWLFTPAEDQYASLEGIAAITVKRAVPAVSAAPTVAGRVYNPSITLKDDDLSGGTVTGVGGNTLEGGWGWQSANIVPNVAGSGYVAVFTPKDITNYETVAVAVTVDVTKAVPYIAELPAAARITYGDTLNASALSGGTVLYGNGKGQAGDSDGNTAAVAGTFTWKEPSAKPVVADSSVTEYTVVFTPSDTANYNPVEAKVTLTINKAQNAPNMPGSTMDVSNSLEKAGDVLLPEGWEWQASDRDTVLEVGKPVSAVAVYTGADKGSYEKETVTVAITRSACDHVAGDILYTGAGEMAPTCTEDGAGHRECTKCGSVVESGIVVKALGHTGGTAACSKRAVCTRCNQSYGDLDSSVHGGTEIRRFVEAACTAGGYTGDVCCVDCGAKIETGSVTPALGHDYTNTVTKEPTTDSEGTRTYTCTRCGHSYTEGIPKLPEETQEPPQEGSGSGTGGSSGSGAGSSTGSGTGSSTGSGTGGSSGSGIGGFGGTGSSSGSTGSGTVTEQKQPFIKDSSGREGWDAIRAEAETAAAAQAGGTVAVDMNGSASVPGSVFAAVREKDVTLCFDMGGGITWSVNGKDITAETAGDTDFSVKAGAGAIPEELIAETASGLAHLELSLAHEGAFGFTATLTLRIISRDGNGIAAGSSGTAADYTGMYANLFYYNPALHILEFICAGRIGEDGTADLPFAHASDYTVILSADPMGSADTPEAPQEPGEAEKPQQPAEQAAVKSVKLSKTLYTYNGKAKKPSVTAVDTEGRKISSKYYTVSYINNRKVGKAAAIVKFKGSYSGTVKKTFTIRPAGTSIQKLAAASGGFTVKWKKKTVQVGGYQIQYSANAKFKGNTNSIFVTKNSKVQKTVKGLKAGKKYYVRIRTYKTVKADGKNTRIYSAWSRACKVKALPQ